MVAEKSDESVCMSLDRGPATLTLKLHIAQTIGNLRMDSQWDATLRPKKFVLDKV